VSTIGQRVDQLDLERQDWEGGALGLLSLILLVLIDLCYHRRNNISGTLVMAPVLAAGLARPFIVAGVGAFSVGGAFALAEYDMGNGGSIVVKVAVVAVGSVVGIFTARHRQSIQDRAVRLKSIAEAAESALLRPLPSRVGPAFLAGWHASATEEARLGGDFYEAVPYGTSARWVIGDVKGHGVEAIHLGAAALGAFREAATRLDSLSEVAQWVDERLAGFLGEEDFVTAIFGELAHDGTLTLINCGHPLPFRLQSAQAEILSVAPTTPLGLEPDLCAVTTTVVSGDSICFHTDGLADVRTSHGRGLEPVSLGVALRESNAEDAASTIKKRLHVQAQGSRFDDDVSVLVVKFIPLADVHRPRLRVVPAVDAAESGEPVTLGCADPRSAP
jgi:sigma-B regulation protein RsbU (phosphoserine phosphatase)